MSAAATNRAPAEALELIPVETADQLAWAARLLAARRGELVRRYGESPGRLLLISVGGEVRGAAVVPPAARTR